MATIGAQMNSRREFPTLCLAVALLLFVASVELLAQATTLVQGTVIDVASNPIEGATVNLENTGTTAVRRAITDKMVASSSPNCRRENTKYV
jgi:hypothetical protein